MTDDILKHSNLAQMAKNKSLKQPSDLANFSVQIQNLHKNSDPFVINSGIKLAYLNTNKHQDSIKTSPSSVIPKKFSAPYKETKQKTGQSSFIMMGSQKPIKNKLGIGSIFSGGAKTCQKEKEESEITTIQPVKTSKSSVIFDENSIPKTIRNRDMWEKQFAQMNLPNVPLQEIHLKSIAPKEIIQMQIGFSRIRKEFIKYVAYNLKKQLVALGLLPFEIEEMQKGKSPENFNAHIKVPFDYGGTLDFDNLIMIPTHPYTDEIYKYIDMQLLQYPIDRPASILYMPVPKGKVFHMRGGTIIGGDGGQAMGDRSVFAGWSEGTNQEFSMMSLTGRSDGTRNR